LKAALPQARLIAAGGVNPLTASQLIKAGAAALAIDQELFPEEAVWLRQDQRIQELARRFLILANRGRATNWSSHPRSATAQFVLAQESA
jgi:2-keto-3-deoxy-6-phosphogluconate aldolase